MITYTPGTRVVIRNVGYLSGKTGVVVETCRLDDHDCCVELDDASYYEPLPFYAHELRVAK